MDILAPAGSYESLRAAIQAGANSVYFGIDKLNMRSRSSMNFTLADLAEISKICRDNGVKSYITLNTVMYEEDLAVMREIVDAAISHHIDAIIASDQAVINYVHGKNIALHLSTQINISNIESVKFYANFAEVVVLARELSLDQIKTISSEISSQNICGPSGKHIRVEVFGHGALCMAVSGKCFLSEHMHHASANRGACYQVCRREFQVKDDKGEELKLENNYILSPKDLCTIGFLDQIVEAGVSVLKIEGRGRSPEYVKTVVSAYRQAEEAIASGSYTKELAEELTIRLGQVFNRGFWEGHYLGDKMSNWNTNIHGSKATHRKEYAGKGVKYFKKIKVAEFLLESGVLSVGETIIITGPTTGVIEFVVQDLWFDDKSVSRVTKGDRFSIKMEQTIRASDKLYRLLKADR
ncbi:MAG: U32 family peptidase [Cytophagia bacterium]|nr:U32 family peptidase [Cytophagia bacterium]